jgi:hypothetical protein
MGNAIYKDDVECMTVLLNHMSESININEPEEGRRLPIFWRAAFHGKLNAVILLLEKANVDINQPAPPVTMNVDNTVINVDGLTPLDAATIELNNLLDKKKPSTDVSLEKKILNYHTIIHLLKEKGGVSSNKTSNGHEMKRRVVKNGGKSKRGRKKRQSKKRRSRKHKK